MRIKLDENMPVRLSAALSVLGNDVETAFSEGLAAQQTMRYGPYVKLNSVF